MNVTDEELSDLAILRTLQRAIASLRQTLNRNNRPDGSDEIPALRDAMIGFNADAGFATRWNENKRALVEVLDAIDAAF